MWVKSSHQRDPSLTENSVTFSSHSAAILGQRLREGTNRSRGNLSRRDHTMSALALVTGPGVEKRKQTESFAPSTSANVFSFGSIPAGGGHLWESGGGSLHDIRITSAWDLGTEYPLQVWWAPRPSCRFHMADCCIHSQRKSFLSPFFSH